MRYKIQLNIFIFITLSAFNVHAILGENETPKTCSSIDAIKAEMTRLINEARSRKRRCGDKNYPPSPPVSRDGRLFEAALMHSKDMAGHNFLSHSGSDGSNKLLHIENSKYVPSEWGENLFAGCTETRDVVNGWLKSPHHCANIMNPDFIEIGGACIRNESTDYRTYWTLILAAPK